MFKKVSGVATLAFLLIAVGRVSAAPVVFALGTQNRFGTLDLQTGAFTQIGSIIGLEGADIGDLGRLPGGTLYGMDSNSNLLTIDPVTGDTALVGHTGNFIFGIEFRQDGTLFGLSGNALYAIDVATGEATLIGPTGLVGGGYFDLAFDDSGNLFLMEYNSLYSVDASTGLATLIGPTGFSLDATDFEDGTLYGFTTDSNIISIDLTTGAGTLVAGEDPAVQVVAATTAADQ